MRLRSRNAFVATFAAMALVACGGGEESGMDSAEDTGSEMAAAGGMTTPSWMTVDNAARTVRLEITAGTTNANNHWNYNGAFGGNATITVPAGYEVTIVFQNSDPAMAHSLAILSQVGGYGSDMSAATPAFAGAVTSDPANLGGATQPGRSQTITFTAGTAGQYAMVCLIPAHAVAGMWVHFNVSESGEAGYSTS